MSSSRPALTLGGRGYGRRHRKQSGDSAPRSRRTTSPEKTRGVTGLLRAVLPGGDT
jgi:hypothetical protein